LSQAARSPVNFTNAIFAGFALLSQALLLWQWLATWRFPLHRRVAESPFAPDITVLKPVKGCDETTAASLQSWFDQTYTGRVQILFGVPTASDPAANIISDLLQKNSSRDARLVLCEEVLGTNGKVSTLIQLERLAKHEFILVSDADVRVPPDFLPNIIASLAASNVETTVMPTRNRMRGEIGLVSCFYRLANPATAAMRWEAVAVNADFWSQVLQAASLGPLKFALGAAVLMRRKALADMGGFTCLANYLADDYQLGHRLAEKGHRLALCHVVVECWSAPMSWRDVWRHQLRWARTIRVCQPLPYFFSILSNPTLWPLLWFALVPNEFSAGFLAASLFIRALIIENLLHRFAQKPAGVWPILGPVKDLLQVALWLAAFLGNMVEWRGLRMKLHRDGTVTAR